MFFWCLPMARIDQMATRSVYIVKALLVEVSTSSIIGLISYPEAPLVTDSQTHSSQAHRRRLRPLRCRPFADPSSNPYNNNNPLGTDFVDSPLVTQRMGACPYSRLANQRIFRARDLVRVQMVHANWWLPSSIADTIK